MKHKLGNSYHQTGIKKNRIRNRWERQRKRKCGKMSKETGNDPMIRKDIVQLREAYEEVREEEREEEDE
jgi:hypothetical protein